MDDGIRERHGMSVRRIEPISGTAAIIIAEREDHIEFLPLDQGRRVTTAQARYLASKLNRLARRIERRNGE